MSKSVTIPMSDHPLRVCVNGVWYEYKAGATVTVPDEVAAVIEQYIGAVPKPAEEPGSSGQVWTRTDDGADWADLPKELPNVDDGDAGKVLAVNDDGEWEPAVASGGVFPISMTVDGSTLTLGKKWSEINTAVTNGLLPFVSTTGWVLQILSIGETSGTYWVNAFTDARTNTGSVVTMSCADANGYPTLTIE